MDRSYHTIPLLKTFEWLPIAFMVMSKCFNVAYMVLHNPTSPSLGLSFYCPHSSPSDYLLVTRIYQVPSCLGLCTSCHLCLRCPLHLSLLCLFILYLFFRSQHKLYFILEVLPDIHRLASVTLRAFCTLLS